MNELKCTPEMVQEWQDLITRTKTEFGAGSVEHCRAVAWAEAQGPALVADYLSLHAQLQQEREARERLSGFIQGWQKYVGELQAQLARSTEARKGDNQKARRLIREARAAARDFAGQLKRKQESAPEAQP